MELRCINLNQLAKFRIKHIVDAILSTIAKQDKLKKKWTMHIKVTFFTAAAVAFFFFFLILFLSHGNGA